MARKSNTGQAKTGKGKKSKTAAESEARIEQRLGDFTEMFENTPVFMNVSDPDTYELLFMNKAMSEIYGRPPTGVKCYEHFEKRSSPCENCMNAVILKTRMPHTWDYYDDNNKRHFLITARIIRWHDGRDVRLETVIDITDQKKIETLLQASEEKYRSLIEHSSYGYFILNSKGEVTYLNEVATKIYGMKLNSVKGRKLSLSDIFDISELKRASTNMARMTKGEKYENPSIYNINRPDGKKRTVEIQTFPIMRDGGVTGFHGTVVDITERLKAQRELSEKSEFLDAVFNNTSDGIFVVDEDLRYVMINPASGRILGHDPKDWIGKQAGQYKHPDDMKVAAEAIMKVVNGEPSSCEVRVQAADGNYHLLHIRYNSMYLGEVFHILGMVTDVTESRKSELAMKWSEEKYRSLYSKAVEGIILMPIDQETLTVNDSFAKMHGYDSPEEMAKLRLQDIDAPSSKALAPERLRRLLAGEELKFEVEHIHKDGHTFPVRVSCKVIDIGGKPHYMGFHQDISWQKQAEQALRESEEKYRNLFEYSPESIMLLDSGGKIIECNRATKEIFAMHTDMVLGKCFADICKMDESETDFFNGVLASVSNGSRVEKFDIEFILPNGEGRCVNVFPQLVKKDGQFFAIQLISRDVTDRSRLERDFKKKMMKFDLDEGRVYLAVEPDSKLSLETFRELLHVGYPGTFLTREPKEDYSRIIDRLYTHYTVSEHQSIDNVKPDTAAIENIAWTLPRHGALLIDCVEFLISRLGEMKVTHMIQNLRDIARIRKMVVIISIDGAAISESTLKLFIAETQEIVPTSSLRKISPKLMEIIEYAETQGKKGLNPTFSQMSDKLGLSKPTLRARVRQLEELGLINVKLYGRTKTVQLTDKSRYYLGK